MVCGDAHSTYNIMINPFSDRDSDHQLRTDVTTMTVFELWTLLAHLITKKLTDEINGITKRAGIIIILFLFLYT
jgi:hypothetical protein